MRSDFFSNYEVLAKGDVNKRENTQHITQVASLVEGIDKSSLEFLVNALTELILQEEMATKLKGNLRTSMEIKLDVLLFGV